MTALLALTFGCCLLHGAMDPLDLNHATPQGNCVGAALVSSFATTFVALALAGLVLPVGSPGLVTLSLHLPDPPPKRSVLL